MGCPTFGQWSLLLPKGWYYSLAAVLGLSDRGSALLDLVSARLSQHSVTLNPYSVYICHFRVVVCTQTYNTFKRIFQINYINYIVKIALCK